MAPGTLGGDCTTMCRLATCNQKYGGDIQKCGGDYNTPAGKINGLGGDNCCSKDINECADMFGAGWSDTYSGCSTPCAEFKLKNSPAVGSCYKCKAPTGKQCQYGSTSGGGTCAGSCTKQEDVDCAKEGAVATGVNGKVSCCECSQILDFSYNGLCLDNKCMRNGPINCMTCRYDPMQDRDQENFKSCKSKMNGEVCG